jgi:NADH dehydrogenase
MMAMIGRNAAVAHIGGLAFTGFVAWVGWLGVHLIKLIGFRNRLFVLMNWAWDYFLFERMVRLILPATSCREVWWGRPGTGRVWARQQGDPANPR